MELNLTGRSGHGTPDEFATLSAVIIDGEDIFIDNGAIHGKSRVERGIAFTARTPESVPGRKIWVIWVTLRKSEQGMGYNGICASQIIIHEEEKIGYKSVADQVNKMDAAIKGKVQIDVLNDHEKDRLGQLLQTLREDLWAHATDDVQSAFRT